MTEENRTFINETIDGADSLYQQNFPVIFVYSALFVVAAVGNLTVFISLFRSRHRKSRISLMIRHLAIADLIVTFVMIPMEVGWRLTGRWLAGNMACKIFQFLRAFGPYLSSNVLVCVSLDRYFAVLHPLRVNDARRRGKVFLAVAWGTSFVYCVPQTFVFRVQTHPVYPQYKQCVSFGFFSNKAQEIIYNVFSVVLMFFIPLFVIIIAYTAIMCEISKNSRETKGESYCTSNGGMRLRRSDMSNIERARSRTLRMTITIVLVYVWCCTPYVIITLWYMFDRDGAEKLPQWLQESFFMMVVSNSCMNPIVYGSYVINFASFKCTCLHCNLCCRRANSDTILNDVGALQMATGRSKNRYLAKSVIKCMFGFKKVGSAGTHSTNMQRSPTAKTYTLSSKKGATTNRKRQFYDDQEDRKLRVSFHSEPCRQCAELAMGEATSRRQQRHLLSDNRTQRSMNLFNSEPTISPLAHVRFNTNEERVFFSDRPSRNI